MEASKNRKFLLFSLVSLLLSIACLFIFAEDSLKTRKFWGLWRVRDLVISSFFVWLSVAFLLLSISRKSLFKFIFLNVSLGFVLILFEVIGLVGIVSYPAILRGKGALPLGTTPMPNVSIEGITYPDLAGAWGIPGEPVKFTYKTNDWGFRNKPNQNQGDIILIGDSILVAGLIAYDQTLTSLVESGLNKSVVNVALISKSIQEQLDYFKETQLDLKGRKVVQFVFEGNDLVDSRRLRTVGKITKFTFSTKEKTLTNNLLLMLQRKTSMDPLARKRVGSLNGENYYFRHIPSFYITKEQQKEELPHIQASLEELKKMVEEKGGEFGVVFVPCKYTVFGPLVEWPEECAITDREKYKNMLREFTHNWAKESQTPLLDFTDLLIQSVKDGKPSFYKTDTHPNETGHEVMAKAMIEWEFLKK